PRRAEATARGHALRWRAADGGHQPGTDVRAEAPDARRAVTRALAEADRADAGRGAGDRQERDGDDRRAEGDGGAGALRPRLRHRAWEAGEGGRGGPAHLEPEHPGSLFGALNGGYRPTDLGGFPGTLNGWYRSTDLGGVPGRLNDWYRSTDLGGFP